MKILNFQSLELTWHFKAMFGSIWQKLEKLDLDGHILGTIWAAFAGFTKVHPPARLSKRFEVRERHGADHAL